MSERSSLTKERAAQTPIEEHASRTDKRSEVISFDEWLKRLISIATKDERR